MAKLTGNKMENLFESAPDQKDQSEKKGTVKKAQEKKAAKKAEYKIVSVKVDAAIFAEFGRFCEQNGLVKSRAIGKAIEEYMLNHAE